MDIVKFANDNINDLLNDLKELVAIPSVLHDDPTNLLAPFGQENVLCLKTFLSMAEDRGFKVGNVSNVAGWVEYNSGLDDSADTIGILCHLDVVPAPIDGWHSNPFNAVIKDGKIYGRGTADDKGPLLSSFYALVAIKESGLKLNKKVRIIVGTDEESGSRCLAKYMQVEKDPFFAFSPDADFPVIYGEKGIASFDFKYKNTDSRIISIESGDVYNVVPDKATIKTTINLDNEFDSYLNNNSLEGFKSFDDNVYSYTIKGKRAHAMNPTKGVNALLHIALFAHDFFDNGLLNFIAERVNDCFGEGLGVKYCDYEMGDLTCNLANMKDMNGTLVAGMNIRYPIRFSYDEFCEKVSNVASLYGVEFIKLSNSAPHYVSKDSEYVQILLDSYKMYTHDENCEPITIGGGTYARSFENAVAYGLQMPGEEDVMHQANEYIKIDNLILGIEIYYEAICRLCK